MERNHQINGVRVHCQKALPKDQQTHGSNSNGRGGGGFNQSTSRGRRGSRIFYLLKTCSIKGLILKIKNKKKGSDSTAFGNFGNSFNFGQMPNFAFDNAGFGGFNFNNTAQPQPMGAAMMGNSMSENRGGAPNVRGGFSSGGRGGGPGPMRRPNQNTRTGPYSGGNNANGGGRGGK